MFNGKMKAVTFSFDDGITQDRRLVAILNRYGLKGTFNINSGLLGQAHSLVCEGVTVAHVRPRPEEIRQIYAGHEIAAHTLTHPRLTQLPDDEVVRQVEQDRLALSELAGYEVVGMAYPCGGVNFDARVIDLIRSRTGILYARTIIDNGSFVPQDELLAFQPTIYQHGHMDELFRLGQQILEDATDGPALLYVWGHAYELDIHDDWARFEDFCRMISGHDDVFYGTNREILLST